MKLCRGVGIRLRIDARGTDAFQIAGALAVVGDVVGIRGHEGIDLRLGDAGRGHQDLKHALVLVRVLGDVEHQLVDVVV